MIPRTIRLKGFTKENRHEMIDYTVRSISNCSGWVTNHTMYSNKIIVINFEIEVKGVKDLLSLLNSNGISLFDESIKIAKDFPENLVEANKDKEIMGSVNITFINDEPDIRIPVPPIPG
ncbi:hypothetical protein [Peribacillus frigoritolerans]|uniref:hypothetical protein n=1 Tax=Peribacillus frigoritolerans TaxID=450367 RepID=UPI001059AA59|nr:hypothetical protein [Peribacillus frigoritolerans]TDL76096.1 hypothetical protein E2R53_20525 [Peribacillus frigoritolerans]